MNNITAIIKTYIERVILLSIYIAFIILSLSGCWDSQDINDRTLVTLVITDKQNDDFVFYIEVPNLLRVSSQGGSTNEQYQIISSKGKSYAEARRDLNSKMDKPIFLGTVGSLVLTKNLAMFGIEEYMFRLQNMVDYRKILDIVTTCSNPDDLFSTEPENNVAQGYSFKETVQSAKESGKAVVYSASDILEFIYSNYSYVLFNIDVVNNSLTYNGYSVIQNNKFLDFIPLDESKGIVWLLGDKVRLSYTVPFGNNNLATVEVKMKKRKITTEYINENLIFDISIDLDATVMYLNENIKFSKDNIHSVEKNLEEIIANDIYHTINHSKSLECDYIGFKEQFRLRYPNKVKTIEWKDAFVASTVNIKVTCSLNPGGQKDFGAQGMEIEESSNAN